MLFPIISIQLAKFSTLKNRQKPRDWGKLLKLQTWGNWEKCHILLAENCSYGQVYNKGQIKFYNFGYKPVTSHPESVLESWKSLHCHKYSPFMHYITEFIERINLFDHLVKILYRIFSPLIINIFKFLKCIYYGVISWQYITFFQSGPLG